MLESLKLYLYYYMLKMKKTIETYIVESIVQLSEKIKKYWDSQIFANSGITVLQFNILWVIVWLKINTLNWIKKKLIISSASLSQTINRMEKAWFIIRELYTQDRREIHVKATKKWQDIYNNLNKDYIELTINKMKKVDDKQKKEILEWLDLLNKLI